MNKASQSKSRTVSKEAGFTLIEAVIAVAIFAIGILGAYTLQIHSTQGTTLANRVTTSANWAAYSIEELVARNYDDDLLDDVDGSGVGLNEAGLNNTTDSADGVIYVQEDGDIIYKGEPGAPGTPLYTIYYNVAEGENGGPNSAKVLDGVKLIRTHVFRNGGVGDGHLYTHNFYKTQWPESNE